jgi:hypothetical protein
MCFDKLLTSSQTTTHEFLLASTFVESIMFEPSGLHMFAILQPNLVVPGIFALGLLLYLARIGHRPKVLPPGESRTHPFDDILTNWARNRSLHCSLIRQ